MMQLHRDILFSIFGYCNDVDLYYFRKTCKFFDKHSLLSGKNLPLLLDLIKYGYLDLIRKKHIEFNHTHLAVAARFGKENIINYLKKQKITNNYYTTDSDDVEYKWRRKYNVVEEITCEAVQSKNIKILQLIVDHFGYEINERTLYIELTCKDINIVKWIIERKNYKSYFIVKEAIKFCNVDDLIYFREKSIPFGDVFQSAIERADYNILDWLLQNHCRPINNPTYSAAFYGDINMLKWLKNKGFPFDTKTSGNAASRHLDVLKWLLNQGCPIDDYAYMYAKRCNNKEIIKYLRENNYAYD